MIRHLLNRDLTVHRSTAADDGAGGQTVTWDTAGTIKVQVNQPTAQERLLAQQAGSLLTHVVHTVHTADVHRGDELGGDLPSDVPSGRRLRVTAVIANSRDTYRRLECTITAAEEGS